MKVVKPVLTARRGEVLRVQLDDVGYHSRTTIHRKPDRRILRTALGQIGRVADSDGCNRSGSDEWSDYTQSTLLWRGCPALWSCRESNVNGIPRPSKYEEDQAPDCRRFVRFRPLFLATWWARSCGLTHASGPAARGSHLPLCTVSQALSDGLGWRWSRSRRPERDGGRGGGCFRPDRSLRLEMLSIEERADARRAADLIADSSSRVFFGIQFPDGRGPGDL